MPIWTLNKDRCALIVVDMQNDFVREGAIMEVKDAKGQIPQIQRLIACCRELGIPVIYTQQITDAVFCPMEVIGQPWLKEAGMREGTEGIEIIDELKPEPGEHVIKKRRFSAFYQTDLEIILKNIRGMEQSVDTIIVCGTVTNICCESTIRDAFFRDYKVVLGTDVCSAHTPEAQAATIENMKIFGRSMSCDEIIEELTQ
ncbi:MAG: cysteine hydrolase [Eubacterium sp.]|nr:cysteine hydrolase [Eubacterium sp.]